MSSAASSAADPQTPFETALGAATLPLENEIDVDRFLPSSRSIAFRKAAAMQIGLYPVWLDFCEDLIFDLRLLRGAGPLVFAPAALVYFRPRTTLRKFSASTSFTPAVMAKRISGSSGTSSAISLIFCCCRPFCWRARRVIQCFGRFTWSVAPPICCSRIAVCRL